MRNLPRSLAIALAALTGLALLVPSPAVTASEGDVLGLQFPAWLIRASDRRALTLNTQLVAGDEIQTGSRGRVVLRLNDGSTVKLGSLAVFQLARPPGKLNRLLRVLRGAFRYTTAKVRRGTQPSPNIQVANYTIGIRGTDLWGKAANDKDIVCLLDGHISIDHGAERPTELTEPNTFFVAPKGEPPLPVQPVDEAKLRGWAAQTELQENAGRVQSEGQWRVMLASFRDMDGAERIQSHYARAGYASQIENVDIDGTNWFRLFIDGAASRADAASLLTQVREDLQPKSAWISRR
ncbi:MAG: SPOR domain-containing protein [Pseudomonadota bacterium]